MIYLHKFILKAKEIDHANGNKLDCRKSNLRPCSRSQNNANRVIIKKSSSKFRGVYWNRREKKYQAQIGFNKKKINLGLFNNEKDAALAYNKAASKYFGDFAHLNDI